MSPAGALLPAPVAAPVPIELQPVRDDEAMDDGLVAPQCRPALSEAQFVQLMQRAAPHRRQR